MRPKNDKKEGQSDKFGLNEKNRPAREKRKYTTRRSPSDLIRQIEPSIFFQVRRDHGPEMKTTQIRESLNQVADGRNLIVRIKKGASTINN